MEQDELETRVVMLEEAVATLAAMLHCEIGQHAAYHIARAVGHEIQFDESDTSDLD